MQHPCARADLPGVARTQWSDDVLRGLRWGAILLAGLAIGVACYRLVREPAPKPPHETHSPAPVPPAAQHQKSGSVPSANGIGRPADKPALLTPGSRSVPPPPPLRGADSVRANPPRAASGEGALIAEPVSKNEDESAVPDEKPPEPFVEPVDEKDADQSAGEKTDSRESAGPPALDGNAAKQPGRGKRLIKAVGRLLGIGRKDPQPR
jgi:hypothetical protein